MQEETRRHPETGLFTLQSELTVTPARGGAPHPTFSCSFSPGLPRRRALHTAPIQLNVWGEWRWDGPEIMALKEGRVKPMATGTTHRYNSQPHAPIHRACASGGPIGGRARRWNGSSWWYRDPDL